MIPAGALTTPHNLALTAMIFGVGSLLEMEPRPRYRSSGRAHLPQRVRDQKRKRREMAKASRKRNRH